MSLACFTSGGGTNALFIDILSRLFSYFLDLQDRNGFYTIFELLDLVIPFIPYVDLAQVQSGATDVYVSISRLGLVVSQIEGNARIAVVASVLRDRILGIFKQTLKNCIDQMSHISQFSRETHKPLFPLLLDLSKVEIIFLFRLYHRNL